VGSGPARDWRSEKNGESRRTTGYGEQKNGEWMGVPPKQSSIWQPRSQQNMVRTDKAGSTMSNVTEISDLKHFQTV
jgi:hypothetical protein